MIESYPKPWSFTNEDTNLFSFDKKFKVEYGILSEVGMGAPVGGPCSIISSEGESCEIGNWCAGPPVWESSSNKVAIPIWTSSFFKGTVQRIGIADLNSNKLITYSKIFRVLDLRTFDKYFIYGLDSPIYKTEVLEFDILNSKIHSIRNLKFT